MNLEQIRAKNAIKYKDERILGKNKGEVVKKVPALIMQDGLLATAAFAKENGKGYHKVFDCLIEHLASPGIRRLDQQMDLDSLIRYLGESSSANLRHITAECNAYLSYLRRFVKKGD